MRADFHSLIAVAFVPEEGVEDAFDALAEVADPALRSVFQHVEDNYIKGRLQARRRGRRVQERGRPMFPPSLWNCYNRAARGLPRTTNTCEAWHRRLGTLVGKNHPSLPQNGAPSTRRQMHASPESRRGTRSTRTTMTSSAICAQLGTMSPETCELCEKVEEQSAKVNK